MQFCQPGYAGPPSTTPYNLNGYPEILGEGNLASIVSPNGSMQLVFVPTSQWMRPSPYQNSQNTNNANAAWIIRSGLCQAQSTYYQQPGFQPVQNNTHSQFSPSQNLPPPGPASGPFELKFHNDDCTSTSDIRYFSPNSRTCDKPMCPANLRKRPSNRFDGPPHSNYHGNEMASQRLYDMEPMDTVKTASDSSTSSFYMSEDNCACRKKHRKKRRTYNKCECEAEMNKRKTNVITCECKAEMNRRKTNAITCDCTAEMNKRRSNVITCDCTAEMNKRRSNVITCDCTAEMNKRRSNDTTCECEGEMNKRRSNETTCACKGEMNKRKANETSCECKGEINKRRSTCECRREMNMRKSNETNCGCKGEMNKRKSNETTCECKAAMSKAKTRKNNICECKEEADKGVATFTDQASDCVGAKGRETQTSLQNACNTQTCKIIPLKKVTRGSSVSTVRRHSSVIGCCNHCCSD